MCVFKTSWPSYLQKCSQCMLGVFYVCLKSGYVHRPCLEFYNKMQIRLICIVCT